MDDPVTQWPPLDADLIRVLNEKFPPRCPDPADSEREIWMKVGERRLVEVLNRIFALQNET